jgi:hypothetical protein
MKADYAAIVGKGKTTHAIKAPWPHGNEAHLTCGKTGKLTIRYSPSGDEEITCKTCVRLTPATGETGIDLTPPVRPVAADPPLKLHSTTIRPAPPKAPGLNSRQERTRRRSGGYFQKHYA